MNSRSGFFSFFFDRWFTVPYPNFKTYPPTPVSEAFLTASKRIWMRCKLPGVLNHAGTVICHVDVADASRRVCPLNSAMRQKGCALWTTSLTRQKDDMHQLAMGSVGENSCGGVSDHVFRCNPAMNGSKPRSRVAWRNRAFLVSESMASTQKQDEKDMISKNRGRVLERGFLGKVYGNASVHAASNNDTGASGCTPSMSRVLEQKPFEVTLMQRRVEHGNAIDIYHTGHARRVYLWSRQMRQLRIFFGVWW